MIKFYIILVKWYLSLCYLSAFWIVKEGKKKKKRKKRKKKKKKKKKLDGAGKWENQTKPVLLTDSLISMLSGLSRKSLLNQ